jgi:intracellular multiplication protein IcmL
MFFKKDKEKKEPSTKVKTQKKKKTTKQATTKNKVFKEPEDVLYAGSKHVMESRLWYRDQYRRFVLITLCSIGIAFFSIMLTVFVFLSKPQPKYFASTNDLRFVELVALDEPIISQGGLLNWVAETVTNTLSIDFIDWKKQLTMVRSAYSSKAYSGLLKSFKRSGLLDSVVNERLNINAIVEQAPVITAKGEIHGVLSWKIEIPIKLSFESSTGVANTKSMLATLMVQRVPTTTNHRGIQIKQIILN